MFKSPSPNWDKPDDNHNYIIRVHGVPQTWQRSSAGPSGQDAHAVVLQDSFASGMPACYLKSQLEQHYAGIVWFTPKKQSWRNDGPSLQRYCPISGSKGLHRPTHEWHSVCLCCLFVQECGRDCDGVEVPPYQRNGMKAATLQSF